MSDNLPLEIQEEIIKRLPVKLLVQFRSVSKAWKSLIDSSHFISHYSNQQQHLLVEYDHQYVYNDPTYVSIVDDDSFPKQKVSLTPPLLVNMLKSPAIIDSCHGLLCLYGYFGDSNDGPGMRTAVIWNPSVRLAVAAVVPNVADVREGIYTTVVFGVCGETSDPKIVKITHIIDSWIEKESSIPDSIPSQVEVFTLSTGAWRTPYTSSLPRKSIEFGCRQGVDGFVYWLATDRSTMDGALKSYNLIISFDMTSEEFKEVNLPDSLVYDRSMNYLYISSLRESLVVLEYDDGENVFVVWMMEDDVPKSFAKLFTICAPNATILRVLEFRKCGEPIVEIVEDDRDPFDDTSSLVVYEPNSKHISDLGINGIGSFFVYSYKETLLLLDQPEITVFDKGERYTF